MNSRPTLEPIEEVETPTNTSTTMDSDLPNETMPEFSLAFVKRNAHDAQLYRDPMGRWVVKVEDRPTPFEIAPWTNYQEDSYMGQEGVRYLVIRDPEKVEKFGQIIEESIEENPPFPDKEELKLFNVIRTVRVMTKQGKYT